MIVRFVRVEPLWDKEGIAPCAIRPERELGKLSHFIEALKLSVIVRASLLEAEDGGVDLPVVGEKRKLVTIVKTHGSPANRSIPRPSTPETTEEERTRSKSIAAVVMSTRVDVRPIAPMAFDAEEEEADAARDIEGGVCAPRFEEAEAESVTRVYKELQCNSRNIEFWTPLHSHLTPFSFREEMRRIMY
ncbi:hypothetical protein GW17_00027918 [Ensete ventricosum]|nr:hypothetical protein GW17_00027918 [Ensete ventricosum]